MTALINSETARADLAGTKGALPIGLGAGWDVLPGGTDGFRPEADSTQTKGVKWSDPTLTASGVGAAAGTGVTAVETGNGAVHKTVITLAATSIAVTDTGGANGAQG